MVGIITFKKLFRICILIVCVILQTVNISLFHEDLQSVFVIFKVLCLFLHGHTVSNWLKMFPTGNVIPRFKQAVLFFVVKAINLGKKA